MVDKKISLANIEKYHINKDVWLIIKDNWEPASIRAESDNFQFFKIKE